MKSVLLIGQSNMAGRGELGDVEPIVNERCFMRRMGSWCTMSEPINVDRTIYGRIRSGIGLSASFADEFANTLQDSVGLIPCADGGTALQQWMPGEDLFDHAVMQTRLAQRSSTLAAILWHQGETDCMQEETLLAYRERFIKMITQLRQEVSAENVPLVIGEVSEELVYPGTEDRPARLNKVFREIAEELPLCAVVSSKGLTLKPDGLHFDSVSCREFGRRYFREYLKLIGKM